MKTLLLIGLVALYLLHNDLWYWNDARLIFGIPVGMLYHIIYCIAASVLMFLLTVYAWPKEFDAEKEIES